MFNLLVSSNGWADSRDSLSTDRILEYTEQGLTNKLRPNGILDFATLSSFPSLFLEESRRDATTQHPQFPCRYGLRRQKVNRVADSCDDNRFVAEVKHLHTAHKFFDHLLVLHFC